MTGNEEILLRILKQQYALSEDQSKAIIAKIINDYTRRSLPSSHPTLVILGAQPGAGKTELQEIAELKLLKNAVVCNADNFRDYHPLAFKIKKEHPKEYPAITVEYAHQWNDQLCRYCIEHKLNYILETTFRAGDQLNETIKNAKAKGYQVDINLLAVNARLSRLGIHSRYEQMQAKTGLGRMVSRHDHDLRFDAIPYALKKVQGAKFYDNIYIYARSVVIEGTGNTEGVNLIAHNPDNPLAIYSEEIGRAWPEKLKLYFEQKYNEVLNLMKNRNAPVKEIEEFSNNVGIRQFQKHRLTKRRGQRPH